MSVIRPAIKRACIKDYQRGFEVRAIAQKHAVSVAAIYQWLNHEGVELRGWETCDDVKAAALKEYRKQKLSPGEVAKKYGISQTSLHRWMRQAGMKPNNLGYNDTDRRKVLSDYVLGIPIETILKKHGINKKTLIKWRKEYGIPPRRKVWNSN